MHSQRRCVYRGARSSVYDDGDGITYREYHDTGRTCVSTCKRPKTPALYLRRAKERIKGCDDIQMFARRCGVAENTAWCYLCRSVEEWPDECAQDALRLVHPALLETLVRCDECSGSLTELMARLATDDALAGDADWRCLANRYAHLRLARLCLNRL